MLLCADNPDIYLGDIRSRLVRLIPPGLSGSPLDAIRKLLSYRLPAHTRERQAREEWREIVEGKSTLWTGIPSDRKECIRSKHPNLKTRDIPFHFIHLCKHPGFLVYFENQLLIRAHKNFSYLNGRFVVIIIILYERSRMNTRTCQHRKLFSGSRAKLFPISVLRHLPFRFNNTQSGLSFPSDSHFCLLTLTT